MKRTIPLTSLGWFLAATAVLVGLASCASYKALYFYSDVRSAYRDWGEREVKLLIDSSLQNNRDIAAASLYYLGLCLRDLVEGKKRFDAQQNKSIKQEIKSHLQKVYALNKDFNLRNLCIEGLSHDKGDDVLRFLESVLEAHRDDSNAEQALMGLRGFVGSQHNLSSTIPTTLGLLSKGSHGVFVAALYNLSLYGAEPPIQQGLSNYIKLHPKTYRSFLVENVLLRIEQQGNSSQPHEDQ